METAIDFAGRNPVSTVHRKRRIGATVVVALYSLMLLAAPMIVRYSAEANVPVIVASTAGVVDGLHCSDTPKLEQSCRTDNSDALR